MKILVSYFHIVLNFGKMTVNELLNLAYGIKTTGDSVVTTVTFTDVQIKALAATVQAEIGNRGNDPHPTLTKQEQKDVDALARAIVAVKGDVEKAANANAMGIRVNFEIIATRTGFATKAPHKKHQRVFESKPAEKGSIHFSVPSEGKSITYIYQYGLTAAEGTPPVTWSERIPLTTTELIVAGLKSGNIVGFRYAAIMHPKHTKKTSSRLAPPDTNHAVSKVLIIPPVNNKGKVIYTHGADYMHFSDIIYIIVP
jgi:hypothetical protein